MSDSSAAPRTIAATGFDTCRTARKKSLSSSIWQREAARRGCHSAESARARPRKALTTAPRRPTCDSGQAHKKPSPKARPDVITLEFHHHATSPPRGSVAESANLLPLSRPSPCAMPDIYDEHPTLYKLVEAADIPDDAWASRNGWTTAYDKDGKNYFSLVSGESLREIADTKYAGKKDLMLLTFNIEKMCEEADMKVKAEEGEFRAGWRLYSLRMHVGAAIVAGIQGGRQAPPPLFGAEAVAAAAAMAESGLISEPNTSDDDGLAQFDQHMTSMTMEMTLARVVNLS